MSSDLIDLETTLIAQTNPSTGDRTQRQGKTVYTIQALRAIAALLVVVHHAIYQWIARVLHTPDAPYWMSGASGVDIFFVISGFVMTVSLPGLLKFRHPVRLFLKRRVVRIVPLYWLATTLKIALLLAAPSLALHQKVLPINLLGSYLFIPTHDAQNMIVPVVVVGWTLNFEMFFYVIFALSMSLRYRLLTVLVPILGSLAVVGFFYRPSWPSISVLASPMLLEFLLGVLIARIAAKGRLPGNFISCILLLSGFVAILTVCPEPPNPLYFARWRFLIWGIPAASIILGSIGLEEKLAPIIPNWIIWLGDASYAIYLAQTFVLPLVGIAVVKFGLTDDLALAVIILAGLILCAAVGEIVHRLIELPILTALKGNQPMLAPLATSRPRT